VDGFRSEGTLPFDGGNKSFTVYLIPESSTNAFYRVKAK
jgi:hypothetical protein